MVSWSFLTSTIPISDLLGVKVLKNAAMHKPMRIMIDGMTFTLSTTPFFIANFCFCFGSGLLLASISGMLESILKYDESWPASLKLLALLFRLSID